LRPGGRRLRRVGGEASSRRLRRAPGYSCRLAPTPAAPLPTRLLAPLGRLRSEHGGAGTKLRDGGVDSCSSGAVPVGEAARTLQPQPVSAGRGSRAAPAHPRASCPPGAGLCSPSAHPRPQGSLFLAKCEAAAAADSARAAADAALASLPLGPGPGVRGAAPAAVEALWGACQRADRDSSGFLTPGEAAAALAAAGMAGPGSGVPQARLAALLAGLSNNAGLVDYRALARRLLQRAVAGGAGGPAGGGGSPAAGRAACSRPASAGAPGGGSGGGGLPASCRLVPAGASCLEGAAPAPGACWRECGGASNARLEQQEARRQQQPARGGEAAAGNAALTCSSVPGAGLDHCEPSSNPAAVASGEATGSRGTGAPHRQQRPTSAPPKLTGAGSRSAAAAAAPQPPKLLQPQLQPQTQPPAAVPLGKQVHLSYLFGPGASGSGGGGDDGERRWRPGGEPSDDGFGRRPFLGDGRPLAPAFAAALAAGAAWARAAAGRAWLLHGVLGEQPQGLQGGDSSGSDGAAGESVPSGAAPRRPASAGYGALRGSGTLAAARPASAGAGPGLGQGSAGAWASTAAACAGPGGRLGCSGAASPGASGRPRCGLTLPEARRAREAAAADLAAVRCLR
jgi:hypothetical protein